MFRRLFCRQSESSAIPNLENQSETAPDEAVSMLLLIATCIGEDIKSLDLQFLIFNTGLKN